MTTLSSAARKTRLPGYAGRSFVYCSALIPLALAALVAALCGRAATAAGWWSRLRGGLLGVSELPPDRRPGIAAVVGHAVLSLLLGAAALPSWGIVLAFVFRGVFYGLVDHGPYDHSWGGPTRGGAWAVHFLVGIPMLAGAALVVAGIAAVHQRLAVGLTGRRPAAWLLLLAVAIPVPIAAFFVAWLHQI